MRQLQKGLFPPVALKFTPTPPESTLPERGASHLLIERDRLAMTIQRAKNREFPNVIVLWPHSATGSSEHLRRLLYNAITRAQSHCSVIVLGLGRLNAPPFAPAAG